MKYISKNLGETAKIAEDFLNTISPSNKACVIALQGDLGAGKTAFSKAAGEILGVTENVTSPTFVIEKIYPINWKGFKNLIHIDAYRIEKDSELLHLGWEEIVQETENLVLIEWPENVSGIIPEDAKRINFKFIDEDTREISYES